MSASDKSGDLTADVCRTKADDCLNLAQQAAVSRPQRIMLEHIAETWQRIADSLPANNA
jgi:hypothetical protein